jgi:predicted CXXCH cytochrome family protein
MKTGKVTLIILAALLALGVSTTSYAFHAGGVAECGGCHSMHSPAANGSYLLVGSDQSSACLSCHEKSSDTGPSSYHVSSDDAKPIPLQRSPGGDFAWVKRTFTTSTNPTSVGEQGNTHGHNIVAADKGYFATASNNATAPGGNFPTAAFGCHSCHDPHGKYRRDSNGAIAKTGGPIIASGSYAVTTSGGATDPPASGLTLGAYRLLAGASYTTAAGQTPGFSGVPMAKAPNTYNRTEAATETRVAYGVAGANGHSTWSNWCGACHGQMHQGSGAYVHPVDTGLGGHAATYKDYLSSGNSLPAGTGTNGYTSLVPFATDSSATYGILAGLATNNLAYNAGPGPATNDQVMCLSCHRAHASGFPEMLRWNMETTFITQNGAYPNGTAGATPKTSAVHLAAYYDRPPATFGGTAGYQRVLCNKCHGQD